MDGRSLPPDDQIDAPTANTMPTRESGGASRRTRTRRSARYSGRQIKQAGDIHGAAAANEQVQQTDCANGQHQHQPAEREYELAGPGNLEFREQGDGDGGDDGAEPN